MVNSKVVCDVPEIGWSVAGPQGEVRDQRVEGDENTAFTDSHEVTDGMKHPPPLDRQVPSTPY
jgi:hypothetical protein